MAGAPPDARLDDALAEEAVGAHAVEHHLKSLSSSSICITRKLQRSHLGRIRHHLDGIRVVDVADHDGNIAEVDAGGLGGLA